MKSNELAIRDVVSLKLPEKFAEDHPIAATAIVLAPPVLTFAWKGIKYIVDKCNETSRFKILVEHGYLPSNDAAGFETISADKPITV